jgi:mannose-1-phosphate guanylyltransferase
MVKNISVDYAILERADNVFVVSADIGWTDLGTWGSLREQSLRAGEANALVGNRILALESEGCLVHVPNNKPVVLQGVKDLLVVESNGVLLICPVQDEQKIKEVVNVVRDNWGDGVL